MNPIDLLSFQRIINAHGKPEGVAYFDEYQTFACLPMNGLGLVNALELMGKLGIVYKY